MNPRHRIATGLGRGTPRTAGFGLLEAIVALALLAGTGVALFGWIQQSLQTATRLQLAEQEARLALSAQALVETVNPAENIEGSLQAGSMKVSWKAEPVEPPQRNATFSGDAPGPWEVGLYRLQVSARDDSADTRVQFVQLRTGLRRIAAGEAAP